MTEKDKWLNAFMISLIILFSVIYYTIYYVNETNPNEPILRITTLIFSSISFYLFLKLDDFQNEDI